MMFRLQSPKTAEDVLGGPVTLDVLTSVYGVAPDAGQPALAKLGVGAAARCIVRRTGFAPERYVVVRES